MEDTGFMIIILCLLNVKKGLCVLTFVSNYSIKILIKCNHFIDVRLIDKSKLILFQQWATSREIYFAKLRVKYSRGRCCIVSIDNTIVNGVFICISPPFHPL